MYVCRCDCCVDNCPCMCPDDDLLTEDKMICCCCSCARNSCMRMCKRRMKIFTPAVLNMTAVLIPAAQARARPQGLGRAEPNSDPFLPDPKGRIDATMALTDPLGFLKVIVGPTAWNNMVRAGKAFGCLVILALVLFGIALAIYIFFQISGGVVDFYGAKIKI
jgi:hypothetical protein